MKLVKLEQYFGSNPYLKNRYVYKADDDIQIGDLVWDDGDKGYVGRVIEFELNPSYNLEAYKWTRKCTPETALEYLKQGHVQYLISSNLKSYQKMLDRGGYDDPNFGWMSCDLEDDYWPDEYEMLEDPQYNKWAEEWANNILKNWGVI